MLLRGAVYVAAVKPGCGREEAREEVFFRADARALQWLVWCIVLRNVTNEEGPETREAGQRTCQTIAPPSCLVERKAVRILRSYKQLDVEGDRQVHGRRGDAARHVGKCSLSSRPSDNRGGSAESSNVTAQLATSTALSRRVSASWV
jgi:hypothetical protein